MNERWFLKAFYIDPSEGGTVKAGTDLLPFYARSSKSMRDTARLGKRHDSAFKGAGGLRTVVDMDAFGGPAVRLGEDLYHAASGTGYANGSGYSVREREDPNGSRYTAYFGGKDVPPEEDLEELAYILKVMMKGGPLEKEPVKPGNVLMLMSAPEDAVVNTDDLLYDSWDAWRDNNHEVQVKSYTPVEQVPVKDYLQAGGGVDWKALLNDWLPYEPGLTLSDRTAKDIISSFSNDAKALRRQSLINDTLIDCSSF